MTRSNTNYRMALVAPTAGGSIREAHHYEYDLNGNIVYAGTARLKPDMTVQPDTVQRGREERFRWDEENRLTALSLLVTDGNGEVSQQVEYLPYGEFFLERQAGNYATPYKFNGKELDEETGLY